MLEIPERSLRLLSYLRGIKIRDQTISITVDIEDWYHVPSVCGSPFSRYRDTADFFSKWTDRYDYLTEPTMRVLDILDTHNVCATFFVVGEVVERYPGLVESIADRGHEIACHSMHHPCVINPRTKTPMMTPNEFKMNTLLAKKLLEKASGKKVTGYRAPNALVAGWMIDALEEIGFKYDSSVNVNSFFHKNGSPVEDVSTIPYYPCMSSLSVGSKRDIVEFPWARFEAGLNIPAYGGPILRFLGSNITLQGLKQSLKRGHTVFYFHPIDISDEQFPHVGKHRPGYWMIKGSVIEKRINHILKSLEAVSKVTLREALASCEVFGHESPVTGIRSEVENILSA